MNPNPVNNNVNKIFFGSIIWGVFYLYPFFNESIWESTLFGSLFGGSYSYILVYAIQIVFFLFLNFNLYHYTIGKKYNLFDIDRFFRVFIFSALLVLVTQFLLILFNLSFHFGVIGYFIGQNNYSNLLVFESIWVYAFYTIGTILMSIYIAGILVYFYQVQKMNMEFPFSMLLRLLVSLFLYGLVLGTSPNGFNFVQLGFSILYILFAMLVYIKSKYSLKALFVSLIVLFLL
ncbi:MAG: hypothetical protein Q7I99_05385 [Acholeplasmataceae bacterium]|nr:hypothetical protein [Acholeplasmataceae bacterium]